MTFTDTLWRDTADLRKAIDDLPFLQAVKDGSLDREVFVGYLAQDTYYLVDYSRALALVAAQAPSPASARFWITASHNALVAEQELHAARVADLSAHTPSPTTVGYSSFLLGQAATAGYPVAAAALLPCFWLYADVGSRLLAEAADLTGHPYADWIQAYGDPAFATEAAGAREQVDEAARNTDRAGRAAMAAAYRTATRFEWLFWDAAYRQENWPV